MLPDDHWAVSQDREQRLSRRRKNMGTNLASAIRLMLSLCQ